jgi:DNA-directed RNA polymerase subunit F
VAHDEFDFSEEARITNEELATEIARITPLTTAKLAEILPKREDKERLKTLIEIVKGAQSTNEKVAALRSNIGELGGVVVTILKELL